MLRPRAGGLGPEGPGEKPWGHLSATALPQAGELIAVALLTRLLTPGLTGHWWGMRGIKGDEEGPKCSRCFAFGRCDGFCFGL